jgi:hypothetical protein
MKKVILSSLVLDFLSGCSMTLPVSGSSFSIKEADKTGSSKATLLFGFIPLGGNASVVAAAKNGNIDKIATVDLKTTNFLNIITTYETKVTGHK